MDVHSSQGRAVSGGLVVGDCAPFTEGAGFVGVCCFASQWTAALFAPASPPNVPQAWDRTGTCSADGSPVLNYIFRRPANVQYCFGYTDSTVSNFF